MTRDLGRVYVTGADGFIGSHLVEALLAAGHDVTALCIYNSFGRYGWLDPLASKCSDHFRLILGDVRDPFFVESTMKGHATVFHLASLIAIPYSYSAPQSYIETNIVGTLNVAQAALKAGVKRFVHTSTSEVYGTARSVPIKEEHPLQGQSPYSASKIGADMLVESFFRSFALPAVTLRPFNTFGPRQSLRAVIPTIIAQVAAGKREIHMGSTTPTRDFNYVGDTVAAFLAVANADDCVLGQTYNSGSGREISIGDLVRLVGSLLEVELQTVSEDARLRPESSEVFRLLADASKLRSTTGWAPQVRLEDGILRVADWMKKNQLNMDASVYRV